MLTQYHHYLHEQGKHIVYAAFPDFLINRLHAVLVLRVSRALSPVIHKKDELGQSLIIERK